MSRASRGALALLVIAGAPDAKAQLSPEHALLAFGLKAGTQPPPSVMLAPTYFAWDVHRLRDRGGDAISIGAFDITSASLFAWIVTPKKVLGANYGIEVVLPFVSNAIELPRVGVSNRTALGLADVYLAPVNLGWHTRRADYIGGLAAYLPTGRYHPASSDNKGLGMWSYEASAGATVFFDTTQQWHASAIAFYEAHAKKRGVDLRVGDVLTIEGGVGGTFMKGGLTTGLVYGAQWKVTSDGGSAFPPDVGPGRNRLYTLGPEFTYAAAALPWTSSLTARFLWDLGARSGFEGNRVAVFATIGRLSPAPRLNRE